MLPPLGGPGRSFALYALAPSLLAAHAGLELLAFWSPLARLEARFTAIRDPHYPKLALCRSCGAPLTIGLGAILARCAYCGVDNLLRMLRRAAFQRGREADEQGRAQLDDAVANVRMLREQRRLVRGIGLTTILGLIGVMAIALWNR